MCASSIQLFWFLRFEKPTIMPFHISLLASEIELLFQNQIPKAQIPKAGGFCAAVVAATLIQNFETVMFLFQGNELMNWRVKTLGCALNLGIIQKSQLLLF